MKILFAPDAIEEIKGYLPVFATREYLSAISSEYGWFVSDKFVLPFVIKKSFFVRRMIFTTETIYRSPSFTREEEKLFLSEVLAFARKMEVDFLGQPQANAVFSVYPEGSIFCEFGSYYLDLSRSEEELFNKLHGKHRNAIRKAMKDGIEIVSGESYIDDCYYLIKRTMLRQRKPFVSREQLKKFHDNLQENVSFYVARKENVPQGCAVLFWNKLGGYYLYGGSLENPYPGSLNYLHWQAILDMKRKGVKIYDFVGARINPPAGSKPESLQRFKSRFGADLRRGYLWKYPLRKFKYGFYQNLKYLYQMMRWQKISRDIIDEERCRK